MVRNLRFLYLLLFIFAGSAGAQTDSAKGWHLLDLQTDHYNGISLNKGYNFLKGKKSKKVIVAVIDSGIDTTHEDLKNVLWNNEGEIGGNGIDDDGNGYIDDVHGWNFLGGKDGRNINTEAPEVSRIYHRYKHKYLQQMMENDTLRPDSEEYQLWKKAAKELDVNPKDQVELRFLEMAYKTACKHDKVLREQMKKEEYNAADVERFIPQSSQVKQAKFGYLTFLKITDLDPEETNKSIFAQLQEYIDSKKKVAVAKENAPENNRLQIVGDDYFNINDRFYGNNNIMGPAPLHGTHVSGTIAAQRNNGIGVDGVADNVSIMTLRAVPDGDEYDKDVALAITYAVDNGAKIINMSFGKNFSPEKRWVDDAVKYAEQKDVLIIHAAGNEAENVDSTDNFPNPYLKAFKNYKASNFITVGASCDPKIGGNIIADFSNYGKRSVDIFAPGVKIYSTIPGGNTYGNLKGTSMAAPVVAGIAALIRSYYPLLSAKQVKFAIEHAVTVADITDSVQQPGGKQLVHLSDLCVSGGCVNAFGALQLASLLKPDVADEKRLDKKEVLLPKSSFKNLKIN